MKLICLNIWGGRVREPLLKFLTEHNDTDIFCFQEVYRDAEGKELTYLDANFNIYEEIEQVLPAHTGAYHPHLQDYYGLATFIKKDIPIVTSGEHYVHLEKGYIPTDHVGFHAKNISFTEFETKQKKVTVVNFHGLWNGNGKTDTDARLAQSNKIAEFLKSIEGEIILCGDFNLHPGTESLRVLEQICPRNLIKEFSISSTRSDLYLKPEKFADYILTSNGIEVEDFGVLSDEVSDHLPLYLSFS